MTETVVENSADRSVPSVRGSTDGTQTLRVVPSGRGSEIELTSSIAREVRPARGVAMRS